MNFHVYVLKSLTTGRRYVGSCEDLEKRFFRHNAAQVPSTKHGVPWERVYSEAFTTRPEAVQRERFFKTGIGRDFLDSRS